MSQIIGWIGLGSMGHRMTRHLVAAGHTLVVADAFNTKLAPQGVTIAKSNGEVAQKADLVILSLPDGTVTEAVCREIAATPDRRVKMVMDTSTIGPNAAQKAFDILAAAGIAFVDAPVSGGTTGAEKATLAFMLGCPAATYESLKPIVSLMGKPFHAGEKAGHGQSVKLLNNFLSAAAMSATSEAIAYGTRQGIAMGTILDIVNASTGRNTATDDKFPRRILNGRVDAGFTAKLQLKDIRLYLEDARKSGISDEVATAVVGAWDKLVTADPAADIIEMYPYTVKGRPPKG